MITFKGVRVFTGRSALVESTAIRTCPIEVEIFEDRRSSSGDDSW